jgi:glucose-1-phosphate cytidylyltransferase
VCEFIDEDSTSFEAEPLNALVDIAQLGAFKHSGWWQAMDTLRDKRTLEAIWQEKSAPCLVL